MLALVENEGEGSLFSYRVVNHVCSGLRPEKVHPHGFFFLLTYVHHGLPPPYELHVDEVVEEAE